MGGGGGHDNEEMTAVVAAATTAQLPPTPAPTVLGAELRSHTLELRGFGRLGSPRPPRSRA